MDFRGAYGGFSYHLQSMKRFTHVGEFKAIETYLWVVLISRFPARGISWAKCKYYGFTFETTWFEKTPYEQS